jgi:hypothetical protein
MEDDRAAEALAFIESLRLMSRGKPGFRWLDEKLERLGALVKQLAEENERMRAFIGSRGLEKELEEWE